MGWGIIELHSYETKNMVCGPKDFADQTGQMVSLFRDFALFMKKAVLLSYQKIA